MANVYSAIDSISTRPRINAKRMAASAPGFRAKPSQAWAVAIPCPIAPPAEAIAIEKPAAIATQLVADSAAAPPERMLPEQTS